MKTKNKNMIVILKEDNGERFEDYHEWNEKVYDVNTNDNVSQKYNEFIGEKANELGIKLEKDSLYPSQESFTKKSFNQIKSLIKENSFDNWLFKKYDCKEVSFQEIHLR